MVGDDLDVEEEGQRPQDVPRVAHPRRDQVRNPARARLPDPGGLQRHALPRPSPLVPGERASAERAELEVSAEATWLVNRLFGRHGGIEEQDDGSALFTTPYSSLEQLRSWILSLGGRVRPLAPSKLVSGLDEDLRRIARVHSGAPAEPAPASPAGSPAAHDTPPPSRAPAGPRRPRAVRAAAGAARVPAREAAATSPRRRCRQPTSAPGSTSASRSCRSISTCSTWSTSAVVATPSTARPRTAPCWWTRSSTATPSGARPGSHRWRPRPCCARSTWSPRWWQPRRTARCRHGAREGRGGLRAVLDHRHAGAAPAGRRGVRCHDAQRGRPPAAPGADRLPLAVEQRVLRACGRALPAAARRARLVRGGLRSLARRAADVQGRLRARRRAAGRAVRAAEAMADLDVQLGGEVGTARLLVRAQRARYEREGRPRRDPDGRRLSAMVDVTYGSLEWLVPEMLRTAARPRCSTRRTCAPGSPPQRRSCGLSSRSRTRPS